MKLFVWNNPYAVSYGSSLVFAVAETVEQAREQTRTGKCYAFGEYENGEPPKTYDLGDPLRIVDLPCAEWHEWSE